MTRLALSAVLLAALGCDDVEVATDEARSAPHPRDEQPSEVQASPINSCECVVVLDEDALDNGTSTVEQAAESHALEPAYLVNDDAPVEDGNPPLRWNLLSVGDEVLIPSGQHSDPGWFLVPDEPIWTAAFVAGTIGQPELDDIAGVVPLDTVGLDTLVGQRCAAIVYDSDVSVTGDSPPRANLQGERYGRFDVTILGLEPAGTLPESQSSSSFDDVWLRIESPMGGCDDGGDGGDPIP